MYSVHGLVQYITRIASVQCMYNVHGLVQGMTIRIASLLRNCTMYIVHGA